MPATRFTIHTNPKGFTICRDGDPINRLYVSDLAELLRLRTRLNQFVDDQQDDGPDRASPIRKDPTIYNRPLLKISEARDLAAQRGYDLPGSTFRSACERGDIPGATRDGARWRVPADAFEVWLQSWIKRQERAIS